MINEIKNQKRIYDKSDVIRTRDEGGYILTYCIIDSFRNELKDFVVLEVNTLKEINDFIKNQ